MTNKGESTPASSASKPEAGETLDSIEQAQRDLSVIREIINAQALNDAKAEQLRDAREYVSTVFTEALNDRQQKDKSVSKLLIPIVTDAVQESVKGHRQQMADYLYPLVGDLVRKFSIAFLRDFIEKTNELIENSLTPKSFIWRLRAWRSGVSFSKYVASQVYTFQIHQVLLIHKETGILLNSESAEQHDEYDSDLVSAMLTAINDFVNDSFAQNTTLTTSTSIDNETTVPANSEMLGLDEIKTDRFTLYVKQGPQAIVVGAVTGNISPKAKYKLQSTLEQIHSIYLKQLQTFNGNTGLFANTSVYLRECLIQEQRENNVSKTPWFALFIFLLGFMAIAYWGYLSWQTNELEDDLYELPMNEGIVLNSTEVNGLKNIDVIVLRDPKAISIDDWLNSLPNKTIQREWLNITETPYSSLAPAIIKRQINTLLEDFNNNLRKEKSQVIQFDEATNTFSGKLSSAQSIAFNTRISQIEGIEQIALVNNIETFVDNTLRPEVVQTAITLLSGELASLQIDFELASATLSPSENQKLAAVAEKFVQLKSFASEQDLSVKLLILGASDNIGNANINRTLSIERAQNTQKALLEYGLNENDVMTSGLGNIADAPRDTNVRKAIFHVILNKGLHR